VKDLTCAQARWYPWDAGIAHSVQHDERFRYVILESDMHPCVLSDGMVCYPCQVSFETIRGGKAAGRGEANPALLADTPRGEQRRRYPPKASHHSRMAEESITRKKRYLFYLLRLWRESDSQSSLWRASLQSPRDDESVRSARLADPVGFLEAETGTGSPVLKREDEEGGGDDGAI
jgi:hypothetical protein